MPEKQTSGMRVFSVLGVALGALSFLCLLGGFWRFVGIGCALGALIIGNLGRRSPIQEKVWWSLGAIVLAVAGAATCLFLSL